MASVLARFETVPDHPGPPPPRDGGVEITDAPRCDCPNVGLTRRVLSNGTVTIHRQCRRCGSGKGAVKKSDAPPAETLPPWNQLLADRWRQGLEDFYARRREAQEQAGRAWWDWYDRYLASPAWHRKRAAVLAREQGVCQGCRIAGRRPTQVHHLTYAHVGYELLFELVAVCEICHAKAHNRDAI